MKQLHREFKFLLALWQANLLAAMEYRTAFLFQVGGMMMNNALYFIFWILFFDRFESLGGWELGDMMLLFGVAAAGFGTAVVLFGNVVSLAEVIANGRLDYYLSLPRPVLIHTLASSSVPSGVGDVLYGVLSFVAAGQLGVDAWLRYLLGTLVAALIFCAIMVIVHSAAFWMGHADLLASQMLNAVLTFSLYPITLFDGAAKFLLFTIFPAAFIGAVPTGFIREFSWSTLGQMLLVATVFVTLAGLIFHRGLARYESGSAIQTQS